MADYPTQELRQVDVKWRNKVHTFSTEKLETIKELKVKIDQELGPFQALKLFFRKPRVQDHERVQDILNIQKGPVTMVATTKKQAQNKAEAIKAIKLTQNLNEALYATYTHAEGDEEKVRLIKKHPEDEGGGWTVFIPSLNRERQTTADRLDFTRENI